MPEKEEQNLATAPLKELSRQEQRLVLKTTFTTAKEALDYYHWASSNGLVDTHEQKQRQKAKLDEAAAALDVLQKRTFEWINTPDDQDDDDSDSGAYQKKSVHGTRKKKIAALEKIIYIRKALAQTTQILGEPNQPTLKAPSIIKAEQNNYYETNGQAPDPEADFANYRKDKS